MFGKSVTLFRLAGFPVKVNASWLLIAVLVTWSLSRGYFPFQLANRSPEVYWAMGVAGTTGLFVSILLHELGHALAARRDGLRMRGITLFLFGGVAEMESEPPTPGAELRMAVAGPVVSVLLAAGFGALWLLSTALAWPPAAGEVLYYLAWMNGILVMFNMIPAFPLDGGRVLRAILWMRRGDLRSGTRTAASIGGGFGAFLIFLGVLGVLSGSFVAGMWWFLIGMFLRGAAQMSFRQVEIRAHLEGEPVGRFMKKDPVTVPSAIDVETLVEEYVYRHHYHQFPVLEGGRLAGCVGTREVKSVPSEDWAETRVSDILSPCGPDNLVSAETDAVEALSRMSRNGTGRLMVMEGEQLVGVVSMRDLTRFLAVKLDLEGEPSPTGEDADRRWKELEHV